MNKLFLFQLLLSFAAGGVLVALLSFISERVNSRVAGIILAFPSTGPLGLFFLAWTSSPQEVAEIIPAALIPLGLTTLFPVIYAYFAEYFSKTFKQKFLQIIASFLSSVIIWLVLALPAAFLKFSNLYAGIAGFILLVLLALFLFSKRNFSKPPALRYTVSQKIARAVFSGLMIASVVFLGKFLNPFWGGVFSMFPAAFSSSLLIIHWYYGPNSLFPYFQKTSVGSISIFMYCIAVIFVFPAYGFIWGTLLAYFVSVVVTIILYKLQDNSPVMPGI